MTKLPVVLVDGENDDDAILVARLLSWFEIELDDALHKNDDNRNEREGGM